MNTNKTKTLNRSILILFFLSISSCTLFAQDIDENFENNDVAKIKYTVLDKDSKRFSSFWEATKGEISFELIELENLNNKQTIYGVEININTSETETRIEILKIVDTYFSIVKIWKQLSTF